MTIIFFKEMPNKIFNYDIRLYMNRVHVFANHAETGILQTVRVV
jgi:hypothetical protein